MMDSWWLSIIGRGSEEFATAGSSQPGSANRRTLEFSSVFVFILSATLAWRMVSCSIYIVIHRHPERAVHQVNLDPARVRVVMNCQTHEANKWTC